MLGQRAPTILVVVGGRQRGRPDRNGAARRAASTMRGQTMNLYAMEKIVEHNRTELAKTRGKRQWRTMFRLGES